MFTEEDVKKIITLRGEIELELGICKAQCHALEKETPQMQTRIRKLEKTIMSIDSLFAVLSENEAFVIQRHVLDQLDWPQIIKEYKDKWGTEAEKTVRSFQVCQTKALTKITNTINKRLDFDWIDLEQ